MQQSSNVLQRYIKLMVLLTLVSFLGWLIWSYLGAIISYQMGWTDEPPVEVGDYYVREGDRQLTDREFDKALESFNKAVALFPDHRGALMGRALVFMETGREAEAEAEFKHLIDLLGRTLEADDPTGRGALAAAHANLGILYDRQGKYQQALDQYIESMKVDFEIAEGPGVIDQVLYGSAVTSSVKDRAQYLFEQLKLPEDQRLMRVPEIDAQQRMHKP